MKESNISNLQGPRRDPAIGLGASRGVILKNPLKGVRRAPSNPSLNMLHHAGDVGKPNFSVEKGLHRHFIGGIKNRWRSAARRQCGKRQPQARKAG
jgi:hypothetical protein